MAQDGFIGPQTYTNDPGSLIRLPIFFLWLIPVAHHLALWSVYTWCVAHDPQPPLAHPPAGCSTLNAAGGVLPPAHRLGSDSCF